MNIAQATISETMSWFERVAAIGQLYVLEPQESQHRCAAKASGAVRESRLP
jgi:hypothetical protein